MRLTAAVLVLILMLAGAGVSYLGAIAAVNVVEDSTEIGVREALDEGSLDWAEVQADGLQVLLFGTAPSEALRFKALSTAGGVVDAARVVDGLDVAQAKALEAPRFSIEILRNDGGISLIGLIPLEQNRDALIREFSKAAGGSRVADLLESSEFPSPDGWEIATVQKWALIYLGVSLLAFVVVWLVGAFRTRS